MKFKDKIVLITGASSGIGKALALEFAAQGAKVAVTARRIEKLQEVVRQIEEKGGEAKAFFCDVTKPETVEKAANDTVEQFGAIDVAVANAGFGVAGYFTKIKADDFERQFATNFFGVIHTIYAVLPHLQKSKGRLALMGSVAGKIGMSKISAYCASKYAVNGLGESLYYEFLRDGITLTRINPGFVESDIAKVDNEGNYDEKRKETRPKNLIVPADKAARQMVKAIYKRKPEAIITGHAKALAFLQGHFPGTLRMILSMGKKK